MRQLGGGIDRVTAGMAAKELFDTPPTISFYPAGNRCRCGAAALVYKTRTKLVATMEIGEFVAHETVMVCPECQHRITAEELRTLAPSRCRFGFNVIVFVGTELFVHCRTEEDVQAALRQHHIGVSLSEIGYLGKKFIALLALAHRESQSKTQKLLATRGGYILHLDGTTEGDSPSLMTALDELSEIVLDNVKLPSERTALIVPFLRQLHKAYGPPLAVVSDMGVGIGSAVAQVFPSVPDFICHFHFLRDIGADLFGADYDTLRKGLQYYGLRSALRKFAAQLKRSIDQDNALNSALEAYLHDNHEGMPPQKLPGLVAAYTLAHWILAAPKESKGHGFPFDRTVLSYYQRMQNVKERLPHLKSLHASQDRHLLRLQKIIAPILKDFPLARARQSLEEKIPIFDRLRQAMGIATPDSHKSLNDDGQDVPLQTIKERVTAFRNADDIAPLARSTSAFQKMFKQIDKYWNKLFADPITVMTKQGAVLIQPQRTNNILERFFRDLKRGARKKTGNHALSKTLKAMLADTPLVKNLDNPEYMNLLLNGSPSLADRFSKIDTQLVRKLLDNRQESAERVPSALKKLLRLPNLPQKLTHLAPFRLAA